MSQLKLIFRAGLVCISIAMAGLSAQAEGKKDNWEFFDYGEERGWANENAAGNAVAVYECVRHAGTSAVIFRATGYMEKYVQGKLGDYMVTALMGDHEDNVFVAPSEYFGLEFMLPAQLPDDMSKANLKICARASSGTPAEPECNAFTGPGFAEMIADLCN